MTSGPLSEYSDFLCRNCLLGYCKGNDSACQDLFSIELQGTMVLVSCSHNHTRDEDE